MPESFAGEGEAEASVHCFFELDTGSVVSFDFVGVTRERTGMCECGDRAASVCGRLAVFGVVLPGVVLPGVARLAVGETIPMGISDGR